MLRVYLDNCCYNRPYDDQDQLRISMEAEAKLNIQAGIRSGELELVSSYVLRYEVARNPHFNTQINIMSFLEQYTVLYVGTDYRESVKKEAERIQETGIKTMDALHIASAICASADYFLTTDDRLMTFQDDRIRVRNPITFLREWEEEK